MASSGIGQRVRNEIEKAIKIHQAMPEQAEIWRLLSAEEVADKEIGTFYQAYFATGEKCVLGQNERELPSVAGVF